MEVCWPGSSDDDDTAEVLCCPYKVLRIAKCSSVGEAQAAAERAIMTMSAGGGNEWIVNMKLAAFAAIVQSELGEEKAWQLYREVRQKNPGLKVVDLVRDAHDVGQRPPADGSPGQHKPGLPEQSEQGEGARPAGAKRAGRASSAASDDAGGSNWEIVPVNEENTSHDPEKSYWWQVRKGQAGKRRWGWVDENINGRLEAAYGQGQRETTAELDEWTYKYDLVDMMQTSTGQAVTKREIRRVAYDPNSDEGWKVR